MTQCIEFGGKKEKGCASAPACTVTWHETALKDKCTQCPAELAQRSGHARPRKEREGSRNAKYSLVFPIVLPVVCTGRHRGTPLRPVGAVEHPARVSDLLLQDLRALAAVLALVLGAEERDEEDQVRRVHGTAQHLRALLHVALVAKEFCIHSEEGHRGANHP